MKERNGNQFRPAVIYLQKTGFAPSNQSIAAHLREQADWIEQSDEGVRNVVMIVEKMDGTLYRQTMGHVCDRARVLGLMSMASIQAASGIGED